MSTTPNRNYPIPDPAKAIHPDVRDSLMAIDEDINTLTLSESAGIGINVAGFATGGDGTEGNPWTGMFDALTFEAHKSYFYKSGHYAYPDSPNFMKTDIAHVGQPGVFFHHTGTGDAFIFESDALAVTWYHRHRIENITILGHVTTLTGSASATAGTNTVTGSGTLFTSEVAVGDAIAFGFGGATNETRIVTAIADNTHLTVVSNWDTTKTAAGMKCGKSRYGMRMSGIRNAMLKNITVHDVAQAALYTEYCVTNHAELFVTSYHDPVQSTEFQIRSRYGVVLDNSTTTWTFTELVVEGTQEIGIWPKTDCYGNTFINGTSEGNKGKGAVIESVLNTFINTDFEVNGDDDVVVNQSRNSFINIVSLGTFRINAGQGNHIRGGEFNDLIIASDVGFSEVEHPLINGTFDDNSLSTFKRGVLETLTAGVFRNDSHLGNVMSKVEVIDSATTLDTNARNANIFTVVLAHNATLANPTNAINGQMVTWRVLQTASFTITYGSKFRISSSKDFPIVPVTAGEILYLTARYNSTDDKWDIVQANSDIYSIFVAQDITTQDINATGGYSVDDVQVLTNQQPAIANPTGGSVIDVEARAALDSLLDANRAHGLIAVTPPFDLDFTIAWYPVHKLTFDADALVNKVRDLSGNRRHLLQGTLGKRPIFKTGQINGKPVLRFDGVDDELRTAAFAYNQPVNISVVVKMVNDTFGYLFSSLSDFGVALFQTAEFGNHVVKMFAGSVAAPVSVADVDTAYLITCEFNTSSSKIYRDTVQQGSTGNPGSQNGNGLVLGNRYDSALPSQVDIAELVIYDPSIRSDVESYLMAEYSL